MGVIDKMLDSIATVIKMNDKIENMSATIKSQQLKIEGLSERVIRLETALELGMMKVKQKQAKLTDQT